MSFPKRYDTPTKKRAVYYHTSWSCYARNFQVKDIPEDVVDISYAFWDVKPDGTIATGDPWACIDKRYTEAKESVLPLDTWNNNDNPFYGNFGQFKKLLDSGRKMNITLAIGGWTWSKNFSPAVANRQNFVNNIIQCFKKYPIFNGVSIDWEYVSNDGVNYGKEGNLAHPDDSKNLLLFLKDLRKAFDTNQMKHFTIALCCTASPDKAKFDVEQIHPYLDELHVMTYDFQDGKWGNTVAAHHTNPRKSKYSKLSCEGSADYYLSRGVPSQKLFIGVAFYSRGFGNTNGFGQPASGGSTDQSWEEMGMCDYKALPFPGATEFVDPESKGAYSYDPVKKVINTYDNKESVLEKCKIVYEKNLGGILIWENSSDKPIKDPRSLTAVLRDNLTHGKPPSSSTPKPPTPTPNPNPKPPTPTPTPPTPTPNPTPKPPTPTPPTPTPTPTPPTPTPKPPTPNPTPTPPSSCSSQLLKSESGFWIGMTSTMVALNRTLNRYTIHYPTGMEIQGTKHIFCQLLGSGGKCHVPFVAEIRDTYFIVEMYNDDSKDLPFQMVYQLYKL